MEPEAGAAALDARLKRALDALVYASPAAGGGGGAGGGGTDAATPLDDVWGADADADAPEQARRAAAHGVRGAAAASRPAAPRWRARGRSR